MNQISRLPRPLWLVCRSAARKCRLRWSNEQLSDERLLATLELIIRCNLANEDEYEFFWPESEENVGALKDLREKVLSDLNMILAAQYDVAVYGVCATMIKMFHTNNPDDLTDERFLRVGCLAQLVLQHDATIAQEKPNWLFRVTPNYLRRMSAYGKTQESEFEGFDENHEFSICSSDYLEFLKKYSGLTE